MNMYLEKTSNPASDVFFIIAVLVAKSFFQYPFFRGDLETVQSGNKQRHQKQGRNVIKNKANGKQNQGHSKVHRVLRKTIHASTTSRVAFSGCVGLIDITKDSVEGVGIDMAVTTFSETHYFPPEYITSNCISFINRTYDRVNGYLFHGFAALGIGW